MSEDMADRMPERMSERMSEDMPDRMSEDIPERMSEDMSDRMSEDMPDRMSEDMPDRMSEDMLDMRAVEYVAIYAMVGIIRSEVIVVSFLYPNIFFKPPSGFGSPTSSSSQSRLSTIDARPVQEQTRFPLLGATAGLAGHLGPPAFFGGAGIFWGRSQGVLARPKKNGDVTGILADLW